MSEFDAPAYGLVPPFPEIARNLFGSSIWVNIRASGHSSLDASTSVAGIYRRCGVDGRDLASKVFDSTDDHANEWQTMSNRKELRCQIQCLSNRIQKIESRLGGREISADSVRKEIVAPSYFGSPNGCLT